MKNLKLLLCLALVLATLLTLGVVGVSAADADTWDGSATSGWFNSSADTLYINSAEDLKAFANTVNGGETFSGKTVKLNCDIIWAAGDAAEWSEIVEAPRRWTPIGTQSKPFSGTFDGQGHTVSGLYNYGTNPSSALHIGFFGFAKNATIKNLHITNSYFNDCTRIGSIVGACIQGTLTITGCSSDAYILTNYNVAGNHDSGGIVGYVDNGSTYDVTITDCAFTGNITSDDGVDIGGIAGMIKGKNVTISRCLATGTYTARNRLGGIIGRAYSGLTISDCYTNVNLYTWGTANQGGIIGGYRYTISNGTPSAYSTEMTITNCYYNGKSYHVTSDSLGKFKTSPTRLGNYEYDSTTNYGSISTSSTYYTDSANNSTAAQGNQAALPSGVTKKGGLTAFLSAVTCFEKDMYGNVVLNTLTAASHDCNAHAGKWVADSATGGQKADCAYPGCGKEVKREVSFEIYGISIRWQDPNGIRFLTKVNKNEFFKDLYTGDDNNYKYSGANVTFGTVILPADMLVGELTVGTPNAVNITAKKLYNSSSYTQTSDVFYYSSVLVNFPETINTYNRDLVARSYMTYLDENGERVYVYTDSKKISFYEMANKVYGGSTTTASEKQGINMIMALGAIDEEFTNDRTNKVLLLENASKQLFDDYAASLASQGFTKHTNYEYSGNSFGMYYNDDYVVTFYYTPKSIGKYSEDNFDWYTGNTANDDMDYIAKYVRAETIENVMRVIVEKRSLIDIPKTKNENGYINLGINNSIAYAFPNNNYDQSGGLGYIIQLVDGSFIIIDSGNESDDTRDSSTDTDADYIYDYLTKMTPAGKKPVIAAWIFTHIHGDHVNAGTAFIKEYCNDVVLEQVIYNFKSGDVVAPTANRDMERWAETNVRAYFPDVKIHRAHTGYKFYIRNAEISVLYSIDDLIPERGFDGMFENNESIVFDVVIDGEQRLMFTGDMFIPASQALINMYGANLKTDVLQVAHHGSYGATLAVNKLFWPNDGTDYKNDDMKFLLVPNGKNTQTRTRLAYLDENYYLIGLLGHKPASAGSAQNFNLATKKIYANGDLVFENGLPSGAAEHYNKVPESAVIKSGAIGMWKTIPLFTAENKDTDSAFDIIIPWPGNWN